VALLTELDGLSTALGVHQGELISLVGGGGKTTTLFALGEQLAGTTVLTTTTKMGADQSSGYAVLLDPSTEELSAELTKSGRTLAWQAADDRRAIGVTAERCDVWFDIPSSRAAPHCWSPASGRVLLVARLLRAVIDPTSSLR